ncbi:nucleotidyl transferase AbiEii/AbiGii toxin family protein [Methanoregula sp.]|uniref:nucleotidyl transferase AbiEii/AbiGii toxin family protein n=1 Tax=Methanoregula sp. TaxID=2052170 RepID=UPI003BAF617D
MYSREITETSKSALLELGLSLKTYREDMILSGGWAPYFITEKYFEHCGSVDIDLVLKTTILPKYESIREVVTDLGYIEERPFRFKKEIKSPVDGRYYPIHVDFLCDKCDLGYLFKVQPDLQAFMFEGADIAFDYYFETEIETVLPENGRDRMSFKVLGLTGSIILKGQALTGRKNPKDAYDIFALTHFMEKPDRAARHFNQEIAKKALSREKKDLAKDSISAIRRLFKDGTMRGSFNVESFTESKYHRNIVSAQVNQFLDAIDPI